MQNVELDYAVPAGDLAAYVTLLYRFEADVPLFEDVERADHAQFRFRLSGRSAGYRFHDGRTEAAPVNHFLAATTGATRTSVEGPVRVFGMGLTPAGWAAILDLDASSTLHRLIDADALFGAPVRAAHAALSAARTTAEMQAIVEPLLRSLIAASTGETLRFCRAVDDWLNRSGVPDLDILAAETRLSRRQLERRCNRLYGAPPKLLARKYRALRTAAALAANGDAIDPAMFADFYDQSHMIREIKQFAGLTPRRMRDQPGLLAELTIRQRRALGGQVAPIISET